MGLAKFEFSSFTRSRFTEGGLKFNLWSLDPDHALFGGILSCLRWDLSRSIGVPNLKFLALPVPKIRHIAAIKWLGARGGVPNSRVDLRLFLSDPHQIWHQYSRMVIALC